MEYMERFLTEDDGQGTVEYAILVGMLVIIGIVAIVALSKQIGPLWTKITTEFQKLGN